MWRRPTIESRSPVHRSASGRTKWEAEPIESAGPSPETRAARLSGVAFEDDVSAPAGAAACPAGLLLRSGEEQAPARRIKASQELRDNLARVAITAVLPCVILPQ